MENLKTANSVHYENIIKYILNEKGVITSLDLKNKMRELGFISTQVEASIMLDEFYSDNSVSMVCYNVKGLGVMYREYSLITKDYLNSVDDNECCCGCSCEDCDCDGSDCNCDGNCCNTYDCDDEDDYNNIPDPYYTDNGDIVDYDSIKYVLVCGLCDTELKVDGLDHYICPICGFQDKILSKIFENTPSIVAVN